MFCIDSSKKEAQELQARLSTVMQQLKEKDEQVQEHCQEIEMVSANLHTHVCSPHGIFPHYVCTFDGAFDYNDVQRVFPVVLPVLGIQSSSWHTSLRRPCCRTLCSISPACNKVYCSTVLATMEVLVLQPLVTECDCKWSTVIIPLPSSVLLMMQTHAAL